MTSTHNYHIISIQYLPHTCLPEKSCLHCLRILIMSWLFKDPAVIMKEIMSCLRIQLTVAWLNLTIPNQTVKNDPKAKEIKLNQMNFFLKKQLTKFSCTYWPLSFCKIFKKILRANPELWECAIFGTKMANLSRTKHFLIQIIAITFIYLLALFIVQNLKNSHSGYRVMRKHHFWV